MDDHAGGLVDDRDVLVLIHDVERNLLGARLDHVGLRYLEVDDVPYGHPVRWVGRMIVHKGEVAFDQPRRRGAAQLGLVLGKKAVEPRRRLRGDQPAGLRRSRYPPIISTTPIEIAESATLNTGQKWKLMKSVTVPCTMRS